jgi:osomolarity two-component system response regulator SSK1
MQALIDFDGWRKWKDFADKSENMDSKSKMTASFQGVAPPKKTTTNLSPTTAANPPDSASMSVNGTGPSKKDEERKSKRKSLGIVPPPVLPEENEAETPEAGASGS